MKAPAGLRKARGLLADCWREVVRHERKRSRECDGIASAIKWGVVTEGGARPGGDLTRPSGLQIIEKTCVFRVLARWGLQNHGNTCVFCMFYHLGAYKIIEKTSVVRVLAS